jgi:hypothetical protein
MCQNFSQFLLYSEVVVGMQKRRNDIVHHRDVMTCVTKGNHGLIRNDLTEAMELIAFKTFFGQRQLYVSST